MAYASLESLPEARADFRAGQICAVMGNLHRKEGSEPLTPADFIPPPEFNEDWAGAAADGVDTILLPDPEAQSRLIMAAVFGLTD